LACHQRKAAALTLFELGQQQKAEHFCKIERLELLPSSMTALILLFLPENRATGVTEFLRMSGNPILFEFQFHEIVRKESISPSLVFRPTLLQHFSNFINL